MKVLVFSDTHLTGKFNQDKFDQIDSLISQDWDRIIINGDFWDGYSASFDEFVNSDWSRLFPVLKSKTVYIYGNHDREEYSDNRRSRFCTKAAEIYEMSSKNKKYYFTHGHQFFETLDIKYPILRCKYTNNITTSFFRLGVKIQGKNFFRNSFFRNGNMKQQKFGNEHLGKNTTLICGHTHLYQIDQSGYLNSGLIDFGIVDYLSLEI